MPMLDASSKQNTVSVPIAVLIILVLIMYSVGYARAIMRRANSDFKATKAAVPVLRKAFWLSAWKTLKAGFWVFICIAVLVVWFGRRGQERPADSSVKATPSATPSKQHSRR